MSEGGAGDGGEKVHEPTPQKLADARRRGEVAKSTDLSAAAAYLGLLAALFIAGAGAASHTGGALTVFFDHADGLTGVLLGPGGPKLSALLIGDALIGVAPLFALPFVMALAALLAQQAFAPAMEKLKPKPNRLSPITNAKNKFGPTGLMEFAKAFVKMTLIAIGVWLYLSSQTDRLVGLVRAEPRQIPVEMLRVGVALLAVVAAIATAIGALDYFWQRFNHRRKLRMTHKELQDEVKRTEGDPHIKSKRRQRAEEIATNQMLAEVPLADVVIVNPTHYAAALKWSRAPGSAPVVVAKGEDEVAARIREAAMEAGVPIHSDPPSARAICATVKIGDEIDPDHYAAVAAAIRFAEAMRARARAQGG